MKTLIIHLAATLILFYTFYDSGASAFKAIPRHQQNTNDVNISNNTMALTLFEKIRRFKEAFREMLRTSLDDLRANMGAKPNSTHFIPGQQVVPAMQQGVAAPTAQAPVTGLPPAQPGVPQAAPVAQPGVVATPVAQPGVAATQVAQPVAPQPAPVAQPGVAATQVAQPAAAAVPVAQAPVAPVAANVANPPAAQA